jgi:membrane-associated phospholipid phosphatase
MRKVLLFVALMLMSLTASADNQWKMEPLKLEVPEMKAELGSAVHTPSVYELYRMAPEPKMDFDFFKSKTNPGVKPYAVLDDITFVGVPLFVAGWAIKGDKAMFRVNNKEGKKNTQLLTDFKTRIDDYSQFFGPVMTVGLKLGGLEGRSDWPRLMTSAAMSYGFMAAFVNGIKYTAKEMRPDGSTANSWPSGHTATSFVGATILHKEYGLTQSPWFSVAGYGVATATGVMRVLNNRHWVSDVMSGAGIGILSAELGYALGDIIFKGKGLLRNNLEFDSENPSFFGISMGLGIGGKNIGFNLIEDVQDPELHGMDGIDLSDPEYAFLADMDIDIDFRSATVVDAEGAYFFNKYVGLGGRFRVRAMSAKSFGSYADLSQEDDTWIWSGYDGIASMYKDAGMNLTPAMINQGGKPVEEMYGVVKSDHLAEFTGSVGLYFNLPLAQNLSLGTKFLIGRSIMQELDIDGVASGNVKGIDYKITQENKEANSPSNVSVAIESLGYPQDMGEKWTDEWDYVTLGADASTSWGTGLSLTYKYKSNFSWRLFCDYDYSKKNYTLTADPYHYLQKSLTQGAYDLISNPWVSPLAYQIPKSVFKKEKKMNYFTVGLSFLVNL